jgi:hypothetical protein
MADWYSRAAHERVQVDSSFNSRLRDKPVTAHQWGLLMTAIEFDIVNPEEPERARIVPDVSKVDSVLDQVKEAEDAPNAPAPDSPGIVERVKRALGISESEDPYKRAARSLASQYATELQAELEKQGRWEESCDRARKEKAEA